ncbi:MAG: hypothetical protein AABW52_00925 [Nanoarchaeota archaeon]
MSQELTLDGVVSLINAPNTYVYEEYELLSRRMFHAYSGFEDEFLNVLDKAFTYGDYNVLRTLQFYYMTVLRPARKHNKVDTQSTKEFLSKL